MDKLKLIILTSMLVSTVFAAPVGSRFSYQGQLQVSESSSTGDYAGLYLNQCINVTPYAIQTGLLDKRFKEKQA